MTVYYLNVKRNEAMANGSLAGPMLEIPGTQGSEVDADQSVDNGTVTGSVSSAV